jgi:hypothetical protein
VDIGFIFEGDPVVALEWKGPNWFDVRRGSLESVAAEGDIVQGAGVSPGSLPGVAEACELRAVSEAGVEYAETLRALPEFNARHGAVLKYGSRAVHCSRLL